MLTSTTSAGTEFTIDHQNSAGIMGSDYIEQHGGAFRFQMTYIGKDGTESARSTVLKVTVSPLPQVKAASSAAPHQGEQTTTPASLSHSNSTAPATLHHTSTPPDASEKTGHATTASAATAHSSKSVHTP